MRDEMQRLHGGEFQIESKKFRQLTELTAEHKDLLKNSISKNPKPS
jgi:hypothetical protein